LQGKKVLDHAWTNYTEFDFSLGSNNKGDSNHWPVFEGPHWNGGSSLVIGNEETTTFHTL
jgi:hypothetical protein